MPVVKERLCLLCKSSIVYQVPISYSNEVGNVWLILLNGDCYFCGSPKGKALWRDWTYFKALKRELDGENYVIA